MRTFLSSVLVVALFGFSHGFIDKNVYECLKDTNLTSLAQLIQDANMVATLTGKGTFTIMAPTNAAIAGIDPATMATLTSNQILLRQVVRYHILSQYIVSPSLLSAGSLNTLEGQPLTVTSNGAGILINNKTRVIPSKSDIICNNGIIHVIDSVLIPPVFNTENLAAVLIQRDDKFKDFFMYILLTQMTSLLETGEYTIFAPTDLAFGRYSHLSDIREDTPNRASIYMEILKYHMIPGARTSSQLQNGQQLYSLHGTPVNITKTGSGVMVDAAHVVEADIPASNGVIHAIDHVLYPPDLLPKLG